MNKYIKQFFSFVLSSLVIIGSISARQLTEYDIPRISTVDHNVGKYKIPSPYMTKMKELMQNPNAGAKADILLEKWSNNKDADYYLFVASVVFGNSLTDYNTSGVDFGSSSNLPYYIASNDTTAIIYQNNKVLSFNGLVYGMENLKEGIEKYPNYLNLWATAIEFLAQTQQIEALKDYVIDFVEFYQYSLEEGITWKADQKDISNTELSTNVENLIFRVLSNFIYESPNPKAMIELVRYLDTFSPESTLLYTVLGNAVYWNDRNDYKKAIEYLEYAFELDKTNNAAFGDIMCISLIENDQEIAKKWEQIANDSGNETLITLVKNAKLQFMNIQQ